MVLVARMPFLEYPIPNLNMVTHEVDWRFASHKSLANVKTNDVYHKLIDRYAWMVESGITISNKVEAKCGAKCHGGWIL